MTQSEVRLEDLRKSTDRLHAKMGDPDIVWPLDRGAHVDAYRLHREPRVAVLRACLAANAPFPRHIHGEDEIVIVYSGRLGWKVHKKPPEETDPHAFDLKEKDMDGVLEPGQVLEMPANTPHSVMAIGEDAWAIFVTIPASKAF